LHLLDGQATPDTHLIPNGELRDQGGELREHQPLNHGELRERRHIVLIMRFHPVGGEDVTVVSEDFGGSGRRLRPSRRRWTNGAAWS
jgi:hypothetical protein